MPTARQPGKGKAKADAKKTAAKDEKIIDIKDGKKPDTKSPKKTTPPPKKKEKVHTVQELIDKGQAIKTTAKITKGAVNKNGASYSFEPTCLKAQEIKAINAAIIGEEMVTIVIVPIQGSLF